MKKIIYSLLAVTLISGATSCSKKEQYKVSFAAGEHIHFQNKNAVINEDYINNVKTDDGYYLNKYDFTITIGNNLLDVDSYRYEKAQLIIPKEFVVAPIDVKVEAHTTPGYAVTFLKDEKAEWTGETRTTDNKDYSATIKLSGEFKINQSSINIRRHNDLLPQYSTLPDGQFVKNYDFTDNKLTIYSHALTAPLYISHHPFETFKIIYNQEKEESHVEFLVESGTEYMKNNETVIPINVLDDYEINMYRTHIVDQSNNELIPGTDFRVSMDSITIYKNITGDAALKSLTFTFNLGLPMPIDTDGLENMSINNFYFYKGEEYEGILTPYVDCKSPDTITIKKEISGTTTELATNEYTYDKDSGLVTVVSSVTSAADKLIFIGKATEQADIDLTFHGAHCYLPGEKYDATIKVHRGVEYSLTVTFDKGYHFETLVAKNTDGYVLRDPNYAINGNEITITFSYMYLTADTILYVNAIK